MYLGVWEGGVEVECARWKQSNGKPKSEAQPEILTERLAGVGRRLNVPNVFVGICTVYRSLSYPCSFRVILLHFRNDK